MTKSAAIAPDGRPALASKTRACHFRHVRSSLHLVPSSGVRIRGSFARRYGVLAAGLLASLALHTALIALGRNDARIEAVRSPTAIIARVAPLVHAVEPLAVPDIQHPVEPTRTREKPSRALTHAPVVVPPPKSSPTSTWVDVMVAHDTEPAVDATFAETLRRDYPGAQRIALEFEVAPVVRLPPQVMGDVPQRMLRALVRITPNGELELLQTHEYDVPYMDAIRDALHAARVARTPDGEMRWAILVVWFHRIGEAVTK